MQSKGIIVLACAAGGGFLLVVGVMRMKAKKKAEEDAIKELGVPVHPGTGAQSRQMMKEKGLLHMLTEEWPVKYANEKGLCAHRNHLGHLVLTMLNAEDARNVLNNSVSRRDSPVLTYHIKKLITKMPTVQVNGEMWKKTRAMTSIGFTHSYLQTTPKGMFKVASAFKDYVLGHAGTNEAFNFGKVVRRATLATLSETHMGVNMDINRPAVVMDGIDKMFGELTRRLGRDIMWPSSHLYFLPTPSNIKLWKAKKEMWAEIDDIIARRNDAKKKAEQDKAAKEEEEGSRGKRGDKSIYLDTISESGEYSDEVVRNRLMGFVLAGTETTSTTIGFAVHLLATHPEVQERARKEVSLRLGVKEYAREPTFDDLHALKLLKSFVEETLRLYPPAPLTSRILEKPVEIDGKVFPAGTDVAVPIWAIHRSPLNFESPNSFLPERFLEEGSNRNLLAFSWGARNCPGKRFAVMEATMILAVLLQHCSFTPKEGFEPKPTFTGLVQTSGNGIWVHAHKL